MVALVSACTAEARVQVNASDPVPQPVPYREEAPQADAAPQKPSRPLSEELGAASCAGRPSLEKARLATTVCVGPASADDVQALHNLCRAQGDGECHHLAHAALRSWNAANGSGWPDRAALCDIRNKESLLARACHGEATEETLVDLIRRCKRNDKTCEKIARTALVTKNPALAKKLR